MRGRGGCGESPADYAPDVYVRDSDGRVIVDTMPEISKAAAPLAGNAGELPLTVYVRM